MADEKKTTAKVGVRPPVVRYRCCGFEKTLETSMGPDKMKCFVCGGPIEAVVTIPRHLREKAGLPNGG